MSDDRRPQGAGEPRDDLDELVGAMLESYRRDPRGTRVGRCPLPSRQEVIEVLGLLLEALYPGCHGRPAATEQQLRYRMGSVLDAVRERLIRQIEVALCYRAECEGADDPRAGCAEEARRIVRAFLKGLPEVRAALIEDLQAAYDGDPAAVSLDEVVLAYPGMLAISVYRLAHALHGMGVPLIPRIMTEWAHAQTGADIHPGARIAPGFFLDHATSAVIGETAVIGANVKLYQGVTLGALSHPRDAAGRVIRGTKRHPTVEDGVTIYANATVLGGDTVIGAGSVLGGSVFVTRSVPPGSKVALKPPELRVRTPDGAKAAPPPPIDFEI